MALKKSYVYGWMFFFVVLSVITGILWISKKDSNKNDANNKDTASKFGWAALALLLFALVGVPFVAWLIHYFSKDKSSFVPYGPTRKTAKR
jgi:Na+-driven multidrug efflux pump